MKKLSSIILLFAFLCIVAIIFYCFTNPVVGIIAIIVFGLIIIGLITYFIVSKRKAKQKQAALLKAMQDEIDEFNLWLYSQRFTTSGKIGKFLYDSDTKHWCINLHKEIYGFSEIVKTSINKESSRTYNSSRVSSGNSNGNSTSHSGIFSSKYRTGERSSSRSGNSKTVRTSKDTSTYEVLIQTTNINAPLVTVNCGHSKADAERICATIAILSDTVKKPRTKNIEEN